MAETAQSRSSDLSVDALIAASIASLVATVVLSRFGLAGTLTGAALTPVIVTVVKDLTRRPARKIVRRDGHGAHRPAGAPQPQAEAVAAAAPEPAAAAPERPVFREPWWSRVRWKIALTIAAIAFALVGAAITLPELLLGQSLLSNREYTFLSDAPQKPQPPVTTPTTPTTPTATVTTTTVVTTATVPSTTAPALTTTTSTVPATAPPVTGATVPAPPGPAP